MSTRSSRVLHRTFLICMLFVLLLVPQIGVTGTALAAKPKTKSAPSSISAVPNLYCLNLGLSHVFSDGTITIANPPGEAVTFSIAVVLANNCGTTVMSGATVTITINTTCPDANSTPQSSPPVSQPIRDPIVDGQSSTNVRGTGQAYCIVESNGLPVASILPASVTLGVAATGTDINGTLLQAPSVILPVTWSSATAKRPVKTKK